MKKTLIRLAAATVLTIGFSVPTMASPVIFTFSTTLYVYPKLPGTPGLDTTGTPVTFQITADNGGSSLANQTFKYTDLGSIKLTAGSYTATYSTPFYATSTNTVFTTDAAGAVTLSRFYGSARGTNVDNFGSNNSVTLSDTSFGDSRYRTNYFADSISKAANYTVAFAAPVAIDPSAATTALPELGSWAMMIVGMGLVGYALRRQGRANEGPVEA